MPAEWMPHRATWLAWPESPETWPTQLEAVRETWVRMMQVLALNEQVVLLVNDELTEQDVRSRLKTCMLMTNISILRIPTVDVRMRDYGPTFLTGAESEDSLALNDWIFNGWGRKYQAYEEDDRIAKDIASVKVPVFHHPVCLKEAPSKLTAPGPVSRRSSVY